MNNKNKQQFAFIIVMVLVGFVAALFILGSRGYDFLTEYGGVAVNSKTHQCFSYQVSTLVEPSRLPTPSQDWQVFASLEDSWLHANGTLGPLSTPFGSCDNWRFGGPCCRELGLQEVAAPNGFNVKTFLSGTWFWFGVVMVVAAVFLVQALIFQRTQGLFFAKKKGAAPMNKSGQGMNATVPPELLGKFNWGAATLGYWWAAANGLTAIEGMLWPSINLGWEGNELAWKSHQWENLEQFQRTQRKWAVLGLICWLVPLFVVLSLFIVSLTATGMGFSIVLSFIFPLLAIFGLMIFLFLYFKPRSQAQIVADQAVPPEAKKRKRRLAWLIGVIIALIVLIGFGLYLQSLFS